MTGRTCPASIISHTASRVAATMALLPCPSDRRAAAAQRGADDPHAPSDQLPDVASSPVTPPCMPMMTSCPSGRERDRYCGQIRRPHDVEDHVGPATSDRRATQVVVAVATVRSAPSSRQRCELLRRPAVTATSAPSARATWMAWCRRRWRRRAMKAGADRPAGSRSSPGWTRPCRPPPRPAASTSPTPAGIGMTHPPGTATYSGVAAAEQAAQTVLADEVRGTPPVATTVPGPPSQMVWLAPGGGG